MKTLILAWFFFFSSSIWAEASETKAEKSNPDTPSIVVAETNVKTASGTAAIGQSSNDSRVKDEVIRMNAVSSFVLNTLTIAAVHRIHLDDEQRLQLNALAITATLKISALNENSDISSMMNARIASEDVCRYFGQTITGKLRKIENGSTGLGLISMLATGIGMGTKVLGSARFAAAVAGGTKAYEDTFEKSDTEHGSDTLRTARSAVTAARIHIGNEASQILILYGDTSTKDIAGAKYAISVKYQHLLSTLVNFCRT